MTITTSQHAIDLMPQLRDILGMPADLDLPRLFGVTFTAVDGAPGWTVQAQLNSHNLTDLAQWDALKAWAPGAEPVLDEPVAGTSALYPSGFWRRATVTVVVAEVSVQIWAHLDSGFVPPQEQPVLLSDQEVMWLAESLKGGAS